jgi:type I restriction enzyme S subunit
MNDSKLESAGLRSFRPYAEYRESGIEWLRQIPVHWNAKRLRFVVKVNPAIAAARDLAPDTEVSFVPMEAVEEYGGLDLSRTKRIEDVGTGYTCFADGDVVVAKITPCFENGKGALAASLLNGIAFGTTELHVIRTEGEIQEKFLFYLTLSDAFRKLGEAEMYGAGGQKRVPQSFIQNLVHPLPPFSEQRLIAAFLDQQTAKIDAMVVKKERLLELLQEKRSAIITRAVTKGLDLNATMKDSGIKWLGDIPARWEVKRLWHLTPQGRRIMYGIVLPGPDVQDGVPIVKGGDVSPERLRLDRLSRTTREIEANYVRSRLQGGDLVYAIRGSIGEVAIVPSELTGANLTQDAARIAFTSLTHGPWLLYVLKASAVFAQLEAGTLGATIRGINIRDLKRASIPIPPLVEQESIASFLQRETARFDALIDNVKSAINSLRDFRVALISAAVTGKIDVREEAA